ncbi:hypothetical protein EMCRGX_G033353 [Ephydatia muelleri]
MEPETMKKGSRVRKYRRYCSYFRDASIPVPRSTKWRQSAKKRCDSTMEVRVDSEEESYNGTESKSVSEFSELESDVEKEGLHEPPNTPSNIECESEIASSSDIDEHENQTENDPNAFKDNTETSFECPMQHADYFEPIFSSNSVFLTNIALFAPPVVYNAKSNAAPV